jgi:Zn-dependent protease
MRVTHVLFRKGAAPHFQKDAAVSDEGKKPPKNPWASGFNAERPENRVYDVHEGDYLPPDAKKERAKKAAEGIGAAGLGIGAILLKFKALLFALLNFKWLFFLPKLLASGGSIFISLWFYALFWGWKFALVFVIMILAHELGHYFTIRNYGLPAKLPMFIPFIGAYTVGGVPESLEHDAYIALAGPLTGLGVSLVCLGFGFQTHDAFWFMAAYVGAFVNLFNMIPTPPFDGGRIAGALSPALWVGGFVLFLGLTIALHFPWFFIFLFGVLALPGALAGWRGHTDPRFATMTRAARVRVALWYLFTLFALFYLMTLTAHTGAMQYPTRQ